MEIPADGGPMSPQQIKATIFWAVVGATAVLLWTVMWNGPSLAAHAVDGTDEMLGALLFSACVGFGGNSKATTLRRKIITFGITLIVCYTAATAVRCLMHAR
jgi:hypothetical protein